MPTRVIPFFAILFLFSSLSFAEEIRCDQFTKSPLPYLAYGIKTPPKNTGWHCVVGTYGEDITVFWKKENKKIYFIEEKTDQPFSFSLLLENEKAKEDSSKKYKSLLFSDNGEKVVVYIDAGLAEWKVGNQSQSIHEQNLDIVRQDKKDIVFTAHCYGCTSDEFYSMIVKPTLP